MKSNVSLWLGFFASFWASGVSAAEVEKIYFAGAIIPGDDACGFNLENAFDFALFSLSQDGVHLQKIGADEFKATAIGTPVYYLQAQGIPLTRGDIFEGCVWSQTSGQAVRGADNKIYYYNIEIYTQVAPGDGYDSVSLMMKRAIKRVRQREREESQ